MILVLDLVCHPTVCQRNYLQVVSVKLELNVMKFLRHTSVLGVAGYYGSRVF